MSKKLKNLLENEIKRFNTIIAYQNDLGLNEVSYRFYNEVDDVSGGEPPLTDTEAPVDATEEPIDGTEAPLDGTEAPIDGDDNSSESEDPLKEIQKLTGKLAQKMREVEETLTDKDIKYTLNSIISATDITKLTDADKNDIINKIESKDNENQSTDEPIAEDDSDDNIDSKDVNFYDNLLNDKLVMHILNMADLEFESKNLPEEIAFDFCEAAYVFIHDYNDKNKFIMKLKNLLNDNQFKPSPTLNSKNDLEYFGVMIYDAMVKHETEHDGEVFEQDNTIARFTASGGQTVGESELNEQLLRILNNARKNIKK